MWQEGVASLFTWFCSWLSTVNAFRLEDATMALKDTLENFIKYKDILDDLDRNGTESSTVETYERQFMVCMSAIRHPGSLQGILESV